MTTGPAVVPLHHARADVAAQIHGVCQAAYRVEAELLGVTDFVPLRRTAGRIAAAASTFFGVRVDGTLAAVVEIEDEEPDTTNVASLVVRPEHFREGLASELLRHVLRTARGERVTVSTGVRNEPALRLYGALAFHEVSRWTTDDGIPMVTLSRAREAPSRRAP